MALWIGLGLGVMKVSFGDFRCLLVSLGGGHDLPWAGAGPRGGQSCGRSGGYRLGGGGYYVVVAGHCRYRHILGIPTIIMVRAFRNTVMLCRYLYLIYTNCLYYYIISIKSRATEGGRPYSPTLFFPVGRYTNILFRRRDRYFFFKKNDLTPINTVNSVNPAILIIYTKIIHGICCVNTFLIFFSGLPFWDCWAVSFLLPPCVSWSGA